MVGGAGIQLKQKHFVEYILVPLIGSNKVWHAEWFYTANHAPPVSCDIDARLVPHWCWDEEPSDAEME